jgi:hypothetical protein
LLHDPRDTVSVWPSVAVPEIEGGAVLDGGSGMITAVGEELTGFPAPPAFAAVSCTSIVAPASSFVRV